MQYSLEEFLRYDVYATMVEYYMLFQLWIEQEKNINMKMVCVGCTVTLKNTLLLKYLSILLNSLASFCLAHFVSFHYKTSTHQTRLKLQVIQHKSQEHIFSYHTSYIFKTKVKQDSLSYHHHHTTTNTKFFRYNIPTYLYLRN